MPRLFLKTNSFGLKKCTCWNIFSLLLVCIFPLATRAQSYQAFAKAGDKAFAEKNFSTAAYYYKNALGLDSSRVSMAYSYAESCRLTNDYKEAAHWYEYVAKKETGNEYKEAPFWWALIKKTLGDYTAAAALFEKYTDTHGGDTTFYFKKALHEIAACAQALQILKHPKPIQIHNIGPEINTAGADFDGFQVNDSLLYFSSLRPFQDSLKTKPGLPSPTKLFVSRNQNYKWQQGKAVNFMHTDSTRHTANGSFSPDGGTFYFTSCPAENNEEQNTCAIYKSTMRNGSWEKAIRLNDTINIPGTNTTQASIGKDTTGTTILYFASDRPGGHGKMDLWYSVLGTDGKLYPPLNCGPAINSPEDDITPFADPNSSALYFSSEWHAGLGGFDIFKTTGSRDNWSAPENMGSPLNSGYNDLYYTQYKDQGYLSSNRPGGQADRTSTCCNDIYAWQEEKNNETRPDTLKSDSVSTALKAASQASDTVKTIQHPLKKLQHKNIVTVYFDNDYPEPRTTRNTCPASYSHYYKDYISLESLYQQSFAKGPADKIEKAAATAIETFFETRVRKGYADLEALSNYTEEALEKGLHVTLQISGYCSPLTSNSYNQHLARRRISSLKNYFEAYKGGVLKKFMETAGKEKPQLNFKDAVIGENRAPAKVSDNYYDTKNSIFNPNAAAERKVEIQVLEIE